MTPLHFALRNHIARRRRLSLLPLLPLVPLLLLLLLVCALPLTPAVQNRPSAAFEDRRFTTGFVTVHDTINGEGITDQFLIRRIERIAAAVPSHLLASHSSGPRVRYVAQGFGPGDDAPIFHGVFRHPAAALAFGCALDHDLGNRCDVTPVARASAAYEEFPGIRCVPMQLALGASAYEPDRCGAAG